MAPVALWLLAAAPLAAQHAAHAAAADSAADDRARSWQVGAQAIAMATRMAPAYRGETYVEGYVTQPALMAHWNTLRGRLALTGTLNLEALTLRGGELNGGISGEGFVDRRHPHTFVHELVASSAVSAGGWRASLTAGKGVVAFGTDDPMSRPFAKFPANHHLAQILERWVAVGGVRHRWAMLEGTLFNGDEPTGPWSWPTAGNFGDSWAARATLLPAPGVELSASTARVSSPEQPTGGGLDQRKQSVAARVAPVGAGGLPVRYLLVEYARTDDLADGRRVFRYESVLAEAMATVRRLELAARWEQTSRPEEERLADPFRSPRPHSDLNVIGITRWQIATVHASTSVALGRYARARPFVEAAWLHARPLVRAAVFVPATFYGDDRQWSLSLGVRLDAGALHARMGRYGVAADPAHAAP
ncbi:MAG TPA: hypothetical protein VHQ45_15475 [Gemmatimonadaceae bacterium]|nr:hypothetical protein [Gemmatimonadaceae bacterium]